jgi:Ca2+-binding EF-hand superfamily protein
MLVSNAITNIFLKYDEDHNDFIDFNEFKRLVDDLDTDPGHRLSAKDIRTIFRMLDGNGDGKLSRIEFFDAFMNLGKSIN